MKAVEVIDYAGLEINYWDIDFTTLTLDEGSLLDNAARPVNVMRTAEAVLNGLVELHSHAQAAVLLNGLLADRMSQ